MININIFEVHKSRFWVTSVALMVAVYALLQAHWPLTVCMVLIASGYRRIIGILGLSKITRETQVLTIFKDASVQVKSGDEVILQGALNQQQWCISQIAVLSVSSEGKTHYFAAFSAQQTDKDKFRRLSARLRHNFYRDSDVLQVSGN